MNENETHILEMLERMQQQLSFLEKKLDTLIQQGQQRPSFNNGERRFSRPFRPPFGRPSGHGHSQHQGPDRGDRHRGGGGGGFAPKKKFFGGNRPN